MSAWFKDNRKMITTIGIQFDSISFREKKFSVCTKDATGSVIAVRRPLNAGPLRCSRSCDVRGLSGEPTSRTLVRLVVIGLTEFLEKILMEIYYS